MHVHMAQFCMFQVQDHQLRLPYQHHIRANLSTKFPTFDPRSTAVTSVFKGFASLPASPSNSNAIGLNSLSTC